MTYKSKNITIGGIFSLFQDEKGTVIDKVQLENLHAFKLAIDEVNKRTDILPNHHVNFVIRTPLPYTITSIYENVQSLAANSVSGVVGSLNDLGTTVTLLLLQVYQISQSHSMAMDTSLGVGQTYPFKSQVVPINSFQGVVLQSLLCNNWKLTRLVILASSDLTGQMFAIESIDNTYCKMDVAHTLLAPFYQTDFAEFIDTFRSSNPTTILLALPPVQAAMFLEQAQKKGLLHEGVQVFATRETVQKEIFGGFSSLAPVETIMNAVVSVEFWPDAYRFSGNGKRFINAWRQQSNTQADCSNHVDISGYNYLTAHEDATRCVGLNFSQYSSDGSDLSPYAAYTYDATYVMLHGLSDLFNRTDTSLSGLTPLIIKNTVFQGATGLVDIYEGSAKLGNYGRGDRKVGNFYKINNFDSVAYRAGKLNKCFVQVGSWSLNTTYQPLCDDWKHCTRDITFNTAINKQPPDNLPPYANQTYPKVIKLGGLFTPFNEDGSKNMAQIENMNAFLMAVQHINNKTDGILDHVLPNTKIVTMINGNAYDFAGGASAFNKLMNGFYGTGVHAIVGALPDEPTLSSNRVAVNSKTVQIHSVSTTTELGEGFAYRYKVQTTPTDSVQGVAIQRILCNQPFNIRKIGVFATPDFLGEKTVIELQDGKYCNLELLSKVFVDSGDNNRELLEAQNGGALYFVFLLPASTTASIIEQGYAMGIFKEGMQFIGIGANTNMALLDHFENKQMIPTYMRGYIGINYYPDCAFHHNSGATFMKQWQSLPFTKYHNVNGKNVCLDTTDDETNFFLYKSQTNLTVCSGLNYSSYLSDGSTFTSKNVLQTYDATISMAMGFNSLINQKQAFNGDNLMNQLINNVSFDGASGYVKFFEDTTHLTYYARGEREDGLHYKVMNFNPALFDVNNIASSDPFSLSYILTLEEGLVKCDDALNCKPFVYNTANGKPASDQPNDIFDVMSPAVTITLGIMGSIAAIIVFFFIWLLIKYRRSRLLKASQQMMLYIIMLGELLGVIKVFIAASPITTETCIAGLWSTHLGFFMVFTSLLLKSWRVNKLLNTKSLKKMKISNTFILTVLLVILGVVCVLLMLLTVVGQPHLAYIVKTASNESSKNPFCAYVYPEFQIAFYVIEILLLFYGVKLSWDIKDIPDAINESQYIVAAMASIALLSYMSFPIILSQPPWVNQLIASFGFVVGVIGTTLIVFMPKALILLSGRDLQRDMTIGLINPKVVPLADETVDEFNSRNMPASDETMGIMTAGGKLLKGFSKPKPLPLPQQDNAATSVEGEPNMNDLVGKTLEEKIQYVHHRVHEWNKLKIQLEQKMLMSRGGRDSFDSNSRSSVDKSHDLV